MRPAFGSIIKQPVKKPAVMDRINPDIDWYRGISIKLSVPTRCPFSTVDECPRYYQSLSLLSSAGHTSIDPDKDEILLKKWMSSSLWPTIEEQATSVSGSSERKKSFSNYCPRYLMIALIFLPLNYILITMKLITIMG